MMTMTPALDNEFRVVEDAEQKALEDVKRLLERLESAESAGQLAGARLLGSHDEAVILPPNVAHLLQQMVRHLSRGETVTLVPLSRELTTQKAADLLNVSRPHLIKLLDQGVIPYSKTGTHRRIRFSDLMEYKRARDEERERNLDQLAQLSQEIHLYH